MSGERARKSMDPFSSSKVWKLGVTLSAVVLYEHDQAKHISISAQETARHEMEFWAPGQPGHKCSCIVPRYVTQ
jgi:hypothetical protein